MNETETVQFLRRRGISLGPNEWVVAIVEPRFVARYRFPIGWSIGALVTIGLLLLRYGPGTLEGQTEWIYMVLVLVALFPPIGFAVDQRRSAEVVTTERAVQVVSRWSAMNITTVDLRRPPAGPGSSGRSEVQVSVRQGRFGRWLRYARVIVWDGTQPALEWSDVANFEAIRSALVRPDRDPPLFAG